MVKLPCDSQLTWKYNFSNDTIEKEVELASCAAIKKSPVDIAALWGGIQMNIIHSLAIQCLADTHSSMRRPITEARTHLAKYRNTT
jgi:hypothetical protein